jgi:hypothetical protein
MSNQISTEQQQSRLKELIAKGKEQPNSVYVRRLNKALQTRDSLLYSSHRLVSGAKRVLSKVL